MSQLDKLFSCISEELASCTWDCCQQENKQTGFVRFHSNFIGDFGALHHLFAITAKLNSQIENTEYSASSVLRIHIFI